MNGWSKLLALALCMALQGCYHYRAAAPKTAALNEPQSETKWAFFWGLVQEAETDTSCACKNNGLKEVTASTNLGYLLLGIASVGMAVPTELEYVCAKPPVGGPWPEPPRGCPGDVVLPVPPAAAPQPPQPPAQPAPTPEEDADSGLL